MKIRGTSALLTAVVVAVSGCVYPAKDTSFEITSADGRLVPSRCTYPSSRQYAIYRPIDDGYLYVSTYFNSSEPIEVALQISTRHGNVDINPEHILLKTETTSTGPEEIKFSSYNGNRKDEFPMKNWVFLTYPMKSWEAERFELVFGHASIAIRGVEISVAPISFEKVSKAGVYLLTINC